MRSVRARRRILIAGLMAGAAGCTPFRDAPPAVDVRAVETQLGETVAPDDAYYQAAVHAISLRDYARALDYLQAARQKQPDDVRVLNAFGVVYDKLGRFDLSARYYSDAKKLDPASPIVAANQAYSAVLQAREYGAAPSEVANAPQFPPTGASQMTRPTIAVVGLEPANPASPAPPEQVTRAPTVLPGLPDTMQPAGPASAVVSLPAAAAVADARSRNLNAVPVPGPVLPLAGIASPLYPALVGPSPVPAEDQPPITIPDAITPSPAAVIEPTRAANAVEPPPIATTAVPASIPGVTSQALFPVGVNSAPPLVAEPSTGPAIVTPTLSSPALAPAAPTQFAPLVPASRSVVPLVQAEKSADPRSAGSAAARESATNGVPPVPRASSVPKFETALSPARPPIAPAVPGKESASDFTESAAVNAPAPKLFPRAQADSSVRRRTASALSTVSSPGIARATSTVARPSATEAIAATPARMKHTKSAASNSPVARIATVVRPTPHAGTGSHAPVAHASSGTRAGTNPVTAQTTPLSKKLVLIGKPLFIINGSGRSGVSEPVRERLASLRWTAPSWAVSDGAQQSVTTIRYAPIYFIVAHALARTLPFPSRLVACDKQCGGVSLILGSDFLKARFVKTAAATTKRS